MTEWNTSYPKPDRSDHKPQQDAAREFYPELDIARTETVMSDGRPAVIEDWYDRDTALFCRTTFYSVIGIDAWSESDHYSFLERNGLLKGKTYPTDGAGVTSVVDAAGNRLWSVTVAMRAKEAE